MSKVRVETPYGFEDSEFLDYALYAGETLIVRVRAWNDSIIVAMFREVCVVRSVDPGYLGGLFEETEDSELLRLAMNAWRDSLVEGQRLRLFQFIHEMDEHPVLEVVAHDVQFVNLPLLLSSNEGTP